MVNLIRMNWDRFLENPSSFLTFKTIAYSSVTILALSKLGQWITDIRKPDLKATIYQQIDVNAYQEINDLLQNAISRVSLLRGEMYITVPGYRGRCYLEALAKQIIDLDKKFSMSTQKENEARLGQAIVVKFYELYETAWNEMNNLSFLGRCIYCQYFINRCFSVTYDKIEDLTSCGHGPNPELFEIKKPVII